MATERARRIRGTRFTMGAKLRYKWLEATPIECEPLTFGDLKRGERFIVIPSPGDNSGHGGLLDGAWIFMKIDPDLARLGRAISNAIRLVDGVKSHISLDMWVYKVQ